MENGILVVKPDGMEKNILPLIEDELQKSDLCVIHRYTTKITYSQAKRLFFTGAFNESEYYLYLSSNHISVLLVQGDCTISKLRNIKYKIRKKFLCEKSMRNLLHTSDAGNEYKVQFKEFFPDLQYDDYSLYADLHMPLKNYLTKRETSLNSIYNGVIIEKKELLPKLQMYTFPQKGVVGIKMEYLYQDAVLPMIAYFRATDNWYSKAVCVTNIKNINAFTCAVDVAGGVCIVDYMPYDFFNRDSVRRLKELGIGGFKLFDLRYSLQQLETIRYLVQYRYKMIYTGGSNSSESCLTIDEETYRQFISRFSNE